MDTKDFIIQNKIIAIFRQIPADKLINLIGAVFRGGIRCVEITVDQLGDVRDTVNAISLIKESFGDVMKVGAGTVLTPEQVGLVAHAGAEYIISPDTNESVIYKTKELGLVSIPGALTPTEIVTAHGFGADFVKVFPASAFGPSYFKAVKAPLPHIPLLAVGGVSSDNAREYITAGTCGIGIAGKLVNREYLNENRFDVIEAEAAKYTEALK